GQREVIDGVDDTDAKVVPPDAVDEAAGEEWVVGPAHPLEERDPRILARLDLDLGAAERLRRERRVGFRVRERLAPFAARSRRDVDLADRRDLVGVLAVLAALHVLGVVALLGFG